MSDPCAMTGVLPDSGKRSATVAAAATAPRTILPIFCDFMSLPFDVLIISVNSQFTYTHSYTILFPHLVRLRGHGRHYG
jgi:hypothetical protein